MKNLIHAMRDMNVTNSLKASIVDKKIYKVVALVAWVRIRTSH